MPTQQSRHYRYTTLMIDAYPYNGQKGAIPAIRVGSLFFFFFCSTDVLPWFFSLGDDTRRQTRPESDSEICANVENELGPFFFFFFLNHKPRETRGQVTAPYSLHVKASE